MFTLIMWWHYQKAFNFCVNQNDVPVKFEHVHIIEYVHLQQRPMFSVAVVVINQPLSQTFATLLSIKNWRRAARKRSDWRKKTGEAKARKWAE